jgi:hypothetical protein
VSILILILGQLLYFWIRKLQRCYIDGECHGEYSLRESKQLTRSVNRALALISLHVRKCGGKFWSKTQVKLATKRNIDK